MAACSDGTDRSAETTPATSALSAEEAGLAALIAENLIDDPETAGQWPPDVADCVAAGYVRAVGVPRFAELGFTADDSSRLEDAMNALTEEERTQAADAALGCVDWDATTAEMFVPMGIGRDDALCIAQAGVSDLLRASVRQQMITGSIPEATQAELMNATSTAVAACLSPEELAEFTG